MIISVLLASASLMSVQDKPVVLNRVFTKGEKATYKILSNLQLEQRSAELQTFMPQDVDINYMFTTEVTEMKPDGIAVVRYKRPTLTQIDGETAMSAPRSTVVKMNWDMLLTISPINEIIDTKDLTKKPKPKVKGKGAWFTPGPNGAPVYQDPFGFVDEIQRLALFIGNLDSALDFSPKLPFDETKPGDTWLRTVGYTPQKLKGGKSVVRRLDYTFTYRGVKQVNGKPYHRVEADLKLDTDIAPWMHEATGTTSAQTNLESFKLQLAAHIDYDLDMKTRRTVRAEASSNGGMQIFVTFDKASAYQERKIKGHTTMSLVSLKP